MYGAWYGEERLKDAALARLMQHRTADDFVQGFYYLIDGRGCQLGCLTHSAVGTYAATERMFAIPLNVAYLLETIFERLDTESCGDWAIVSTNAIPVGADLSRCWDEYVADAYGAVKDNAERLLGILAASPIIEGDECPDCVAESLDALDPLARLMWQHSKERTAVQLNRQRAF